MIFWGRYQQSALRIALILFAIYSSFICTKLVLAIPSEVIENGDFENGSGADANNWDEFSFGGAGPTAERRTAGLPFGASPIGTASMVVNGFNNGGAGASQKQSVLPGQAITLSAVARTDNLNGVQAFALLQIKFLDSSSAELVADRIESVKIHSGNASGAYTPFSISGTVPVGAVQAEFTVIVDATAGFGGDAIFDTVSGTVDGGAVSPGSCEIPTNSSFEETGASGEEIMPGWTRFPLGSPLVNQKDNVTLIHPALEGNRAVEMNIFGNQFTGIFQIIGGVRPEANIDFSIFARTDNLSGGAFAQLKIEFKDANDNLLEEFLSEQITNSNAAGDYKQFSVSGTAPQGTAFAVLVIVGDGGPGGGGDIVFDAACANFDNAELPPIKITGDVFDATTGQLVAKSQVQLLDASGRVLATDSDNPFEFLVPAGAQRQLRVMAEGFTFPSRINAPILFEGVPIGDHGEIFSHFGDTKISLPMDPGFPLVIKKEVNKKQAARGDLLVYKISVKNNSILPISDVLLIDELPDEFNYRSGTAQKNGQKITDPTQNSPLTFNLGTIAGSEELVISYVAVVGSKAGLGRQYITPAVARNSSLNTQLSNESRAGITVIGDPIFDLGTIVGKVFNDENGNGVQERGERGIPDIRLATEEGTVIYTDRYGRYHIPGVKPGRHIIKIDRHSLPPGTEIITEEAYLVKITEGLFAKVNFAVRLSPGSEVPESYRDKLEVHVTQQYDKFIPRLDVSLSEDEIQILGDQTVEPVYFYIDGNYLTAVTGWQIIIRDDRDAIIKTVGLTGVASIPPRVEWDGRTEDGHILEADRTYSYQLMVTDGQDEDWTPRKYFKVTAKTKRFDTVRRVPYVELEENEKARQTIPITNRNSVMVRGHAEPGTTVKIAGHEVYLKEDGSFEKEILLAPGIQAVKITNTDKMGKTLTYVKEIDVQDDYFFMVGFAEGELGSRDVSSHLDEITQDDAFEDGFFEDGRLAYYLKAKIKGRYLITSSLDTERTNHLKLFTNIDPDRYYPVYGDSSTISYDATDTKNNFYILAEMDKSYVKWGSFETGVTDLELATFNRTLSGAKGHVEREKTTKYGDPYGAGTVFYAEAEAVPDHNEFVGTGGSLYYLKNSDVIEGSEKVQVVTRDKITGRILSRIDLIEGIDYEIDYLQGRLILTRPLSSFSNSGTIIDSAILGGNAAFLVVDYEFQPNAPLENPTTGVRGYHQIIDNVRVGGTFVNEDREGPDYKLLGGDVLVKLGRNTQVVAEYARSMEDQSSTNVSDDGGITFIKSDPVGFATIPGSTGPINLTLDEFQHMFPERFLRHEAEEHDAYNLEFQTGLWEKMKLKAYYTYINQGFSNTSSLFQEGTEKIGGELSYRLASKTFVNVKHDTQILLDEPFTEVGLISPSITGGLDTLSTAVAEGEESHTTSIQITHDVGKWGLIGEYRHRKVNGLTVSDLFPGVTSADLSAAGFSTDPFTAIFGPDLDSEDIIAGRATYHWNERFIPFIEQQVSLNEEDNHQTTFGADIKVTSKIWLQGQETVGNQGNSTLVGLQAQTSEKTRVYINQLLGYDNTYGKASKTTYGSNTQVDEKSTFTTEKQYTSYRKGQLESSLFGYEQQLDKGWSLGSTYEQIDSDNGFQRDAVSGTLAYSKWNWLNLFTKLEVRQDETNINVGPLSDSSQLRQYLTQNLAKWQATEDLELLARFNYGLTEDRIGATDLAEFYEATTGFAYRPVDFDRLNFIGKYTYLNDNDPEGQSDIGLNILERSHIAAIEGGYDITKWLQLVEKYAFKFGEVSVEGSDFAEVKTHLWINRINIHITRKWDIAGEFRIRKETETDDRKSGFLVEVDREIMDHIRLGAGYNFTDFSDDLRTGSDDDAEGFFVRLSGKI